MDVLILGDCHSTFVMVKCKIGILRPTSAPPLVHPGPCAHRFCRYIKPWISSKRDGWF